MNFRSRKNPVWLILLFFLSTGGGVAVFFIWKSLPALATPPDLRLYSAIRNAKTAFELARESEVVENALRNEKPDPFRQPQAYFKDDSISAAGGPGSGTADRYSQSPSGGASSSRMGAKLALRFKKSAMKGRLKRGIRSAKGSSTSGRRSGSSFKKTAGAGAAVSNVLSSAKKDAPLRGTLASLKRTYEHAAAAAISNSGDKAKYHSSLVFDEAPAGLSELSYGKKLAKLDTITTDVKDLKIGKPRSLTAPDPGAPTIDEASATNNPMLQKMKDAAKKAADPISAPINQMLSPLVNSLGNPGGGSPGGGGPEGAPPPGGYPGGGDPAGGDPDGLTTNALPSDGSEWDPSPGELLYNFNDDELYDDYFIVDYERDPSGEWRVVGVYDELRNEYAAVSYDPSAGTWTTVDIYNFDANEYTYTQPDAG